MRRNAVLGAVLMVGILAMSLHAEAQQKPKLVKVGILHGGDFTPAAVNALEHGLRDRGWLTGHNLALEYRAARGDLERLPALAAELLSLNVDVIVAATAPETRAARLATRTTPIVFVAHVDPVGVGDIQSLARPGGNATGFAQMHPELATKQLELLKALGSRVTRVAVLWNASVATKAADWRELTPAAKALGVALESHEIRRADDLADVFGALMRGRPDAVLVLGDPLVFSLRRAISEFAAKERLLAMGPWKPFVNAGGLISYGADTVDLWRRASGHVDRILRGAKPGDLPVEQATKFELVINLKTARALGLTIPPSVLVRADQVIE